MHRPNYCKQGSYAILNINFQTYSRPFPYHCTLSYFFPNDMPRSNTSTATVNTMKKKLSILNKIYTFQKILITERSFFLIFLVWKWPNFFPYLSTISKNILTILSMSQGRNEHEQQMFGLHLDLEDLHCSTNIFYISTLHQLVCFNQGCWSGLFHQSLPHLSLPLPAEPGL